MVQRPDPPEGFELQRMLGAWYVLFSDRASLRERTHPRIDYERLADDPRGRAQLSASLRYRSVDLLGRTQRRLAVATAIAEEPLGWFSVGGLARLASTRFCVALIDPRDRWLAIWHARSPLGSGAGLDVLTRDPSIPQALLDAILAEIRAHPALAPRREGLFATKQDWFPPRPYALG